MTVSAEYPGGVSDAPLRVELLTGRAALDALAPAWRRLEDRATAGGAPVEAPVDLLRHAAASLGPAAPVIAAAWAGGELVAVWPWARRRRGPMRYLVPLGRELQTYGDPLLDPSRSGPELARALWDALRRAEADLLHARALDAASPAWSVPALGACARPIGASPCADLTDLADRDAYLASRSKNRRKNLRRQRRKLEREGAVRFAALDDPADRRDAARQALAFKRAWLASQGLVSVPLSGAWLEPALLAAAGDPLLFGRMEVLRLDVGGRLAAVEIGFRDGATYRSWMGAFAPDLAQHGPGAQLTLEAVGWCLEAGVSRYDMLLPATDFKGSWCDLRAAKRELLAPLTRRGQLALPLFRDGKRWAKRAFTAAPDPVRSGLARAAELARSLAAS